MGRIRKNLLDGNALESLSAGNYSTITGASPATTTRDLADVVERVGLIRTGERRHARYPLNLKRC